jgi:hypothetical protein
MDATNPETINLFYRLQTHMLIESAIERRGHKVVCSEDIVEIHQTLVERHLKRERGSIVQSWKSMYCIYLESIAYSERTLVMTADQNWLQSAL